MLPQITVRRPQGLLPKLSVRKRVVVYYQPGYLLLALPALAVLRARRAQARRTDGPGPVASQGSPDVDLAGRRRRPVRVVLVSVARRRGRAAGQAEDVIVVSPPADE